MKSVENVETVPRQCPAYNDICNACGLIGHWQVCCQKSRMQRRTRSSSGKRRGWKGYVSPGRRNGPSKQHKYKRTPSTGRKNARVDAVDDDYKTDGETYQKSFFAISISTQCFDEINNRSTAREEAFTVLNMQLPGEGDGYTLRLKIDTGASGNTLAQRTFQQMYGSKANTNNLLRPADVKLTAYNKNRH